MLLNFEKIVRDAWMAYDNSRQVKYITDISARVSTNHVFKVTLENDDVVIAKLSYFGTFDNFLEDHSLINSLSINLPYPYDQLLSKSLTKNGELFTYRHQDSLLDAWVVFYNPIRYETMLPKVLNEDQIKKLGAELARFHKVCTSLTSVLPSWSKSLPDDLDHLRQVIESEQGMYEHRGNIDTIKAHIDEFHVGLDKLGAENWTSIPVFVDWNIGNFSVTDDYKFYSRWDYDWFRMSSRVMDFYFFSRVCSTIGDRTAFSYLLDPLMEDRFILFLKEYHKVFPLTRNEILFLKEAYRFFILNYVIKDGRYFFHEIYATALQMEAYDIYFPQLEKFSADKILKALNL
ncbi:MAG: hypothetical protein JXQ90_08835 [Cyclobacteriaceae bacterium]